MQSSPLRRIQRVLMLLEKQKWIALKSMFKWQMKPQKIWKEERRKKKRRLGGVEEMQLGKTVKPWPIQRDNLQRSVMSWWKSYKHIHLDFSIFFCVVWRGGKRARERVREKDVEWGICHSQGLLVKAFDSFNYYPEFAHAEEGDIKGCGRLAHC